MSIDAALTVPEIAALSGASLPRYFAVYDTASGANIIATARVNGAPIYPLTTLDVDGTSGGWSNVAKDMTIFIGSSAGAFDRGVYRVRKSGTASTLEIMAIGENDAGSITVMDRSTPISDNDHITILYRFDLFGVFPRIDYLGIGLDATIYEDYDAAYTNFNRYPPPIINVTIDGQYGQYATHVYSGSSKTFDIDLELILWATSSSVTWEITIPSGITLNSGSLTGSGTTGTINITADHSADSYTLKFEATENNGNTWTSYRKVWIKSNTYPPLGVMIENDEDNTTGSVRTIRLNDLVDFPTGAMWHVFDMGYWNNSDVPSAVKAFTGYVVRQREDTDIGDKSITLDLVGPSGMLEMIGSQSQIMSSVASPVNWQELYTTLSYLDFVIWWVMARRVAGLLQMFNCTLFGFSTTEKRMTDWRIDTGTLLDQLQALARRVGGGNFGCDPSGEVMLRRDPSRVPSTDRSAIPLRASITTNQYTRATLGRQNRPQVRRLRGEAFASDGTTNTPIWVDAPILPGQGQSEQKADRLIVDSASELEEFTGDEYAARNNPYPEGSVLIQKNYAVFRPAQLLRTFLTITDNLRYDAVQWSNYITVKRVSRVHNPDGTIDTTLYFETETVGSDGTNVPIPVPDPSTYNSRYQATPFSRIPFWRRSNTNPAGTVAGAIAMPKDGSIAFCATDSNAYVATNFLGTPIYRDVTPSGLGSFDIKHGMIQIGGKKAWLLVSDGTDSKVYRTSNILVPSPVWLEGDVIDGVYTIIRPASTTNAILIYSPASSGPVTEVYDFTINDQGWSDNGGKGVYHAGVGWKANPAFQKARLNIFVTLPGTLILDHIDVEYDVCPGGDQDDIGYSDGIGSSYPACTGSPQTLPYLSSTPPTVFALDFVSDSDLNGTIVASTITKVTFYGFDASDPGTVVAYSSDNGDTFGSPLSIGTTPLQVGGFDVQHNGTVSIASCEGKTRKATTLGGAYSDDETWGANPILVEMPWGTRNSLIANNSGSSPEYVVGLDAADGSGNTLYWVVGGTPVDITPMVSGNPGIPAGADCLCTWLGKYVAYLGVFGGTTKLVTSVDAGATWIDRGAVNADYLRLRRLSGTPGQLYPAGTVLRYSSSFGAALITKAKPSSSDLVFFEPAF